MSLSHFIYVQTKPIFIAFVFLIDKSIKIAFCVCVDFSAGSKLHLCDCSAMYTTMLHEEMIIN